MSDDKKQFWESMRRTWVKVPDEVSECPECCGRLFVMSNAWIEETGQPIAEGLQVECGNDEDSRHRWWQSDWQPVVDAVRKWCGASED